MPERADEALATIERTSGCAERRHTGLRHRGFGPGLGRAGTVRMSEALGGSASVGTAARARGHVFSVLSEPAPVLLAVASALAPENRFHP